MCTSCLGSRVEWGRPAREEEEEGKARNRPCLRTGLLLAPVGAILALEPSYKAFLTSLTLLP